MADTRKTIFPYKEGAENPMETISGSESSFFTGVDDLFKNTFDPYVSGYAFIFWTKLPSWFEEDPDLKYFKSITEKNFRGFQGISDIEMQTDPVTTGFAAREYNFASGTSVSMNEFTLTQKEFSGSVMRKLYQKWISYIRDPRTGIALYPKLFGVEYGARNHAGELLYVVTRPDVTNTDTDIVEFAVYYTNVMPVNIPLSPYNFEIGVQDSPNIDIRFMGFSEFGPDVEEYARKILKERILAVKEGGEGIPFVDSMGAYKGTASLLSGTIKEIYGEKE